MGKNGITKNLLFLPENFNKLGNVSMCQLLEQSGYLGAYDQISEADIRDAIRRNPQCIDEWLVYSEDKRTSSGWFISRVTDSSYVVEYFSSNIGEKSKSCYADPINACAAFIKREIESIRYSAAASHLGQTKRTESRPPVVDQAPGVRGQSMPPRRMDPDEGQNVPVKKDDPTRKGPSSGEPVEPDQSAKGPSSKKSDEKK